MKSYEIEEELEKAKKKLLQRALLEASNLLAEVHHQINIIDRESSVVCSEYKWAKKAIEQARTYMKDITL